MFSVLFAALSSFLALHSICAAGAKGATTRRRQLPVNKQLPPPKDPADIFPAPTQYNNWAICKGQITPAKFPDLNVPTKQGGCVRYYRGIDITGVVTEEHFFFSDGIKSACDCIAECLARPLSCTNWVYKYTFMDGDDGLRSCTLYSSPNLPSNVTLAYDLLNSTGYELLQPGNNPQAGGAAPLTFLDADNTKVDPFGVSGFISQDLNNAQYC
jgi:hypothetical protein